MDKNAYLYLLSTKNYQREKFRNYTSAVLEGGADAGSVLEQMYKSFEIDNAAGSQLDMIGELVGISRLLDIVPSYGDRTLSDDEYRLMIKLKIAQNSWDGTTESAVKIYRTIFGNDVSLKDNQNMTIETWFTGETGARLSYILEHSDSFLIQVGIKNLIRVIGETINLSKGTYTAVTGICVVEYVQMISDAEEYFVEDIENMDVDIVERRTVRMLER